MNTHPIPRGPAALARLRRFAQRAPLAVATGILVVILAIFLGPLLFWQPQDVTGGTGVIGFDLPLHFAIIEMMFVFFILAIVATLAWWKETHLTTPIDPAGRRLWVWVMIVPLSFLVLAIIGLVLGENTNGAVPILARILFLNLCVGLFEETLFRGIVLHGLRRRLSDFRALVASAVLFGAFHMSNVLAGQDLAFTLLQAVNAAALGVLLGALMLQTNSLWAPILFHMAWNSMGMASGLLMSLNPDIGVSTDPASVGVVNYAYAAIIGSLGFYIFYRWQRRMARLRNTDAKAIAPIQIKPSGIGDPPDPMARKPFT
jgi:membrane protease YdiL (CAAX protease family)